MPEPLLQPPRAAVPLEPAGAYPLRFWWLKRLIALGAILLVLLGILRSWWGREARRRLDAEIAKLVAAGEPIRPEDFDLPDVADEANAGLILQKAASSVTLTQSEASLLDDFRVSPRVMRGRVGEVAAVIDRHAAALELVRRARGQTGADWGIRMRRPMSTFVLPGLAPLRALAKLTAANAAGRHVQGDDAAAVAALRDLLAMARQIEQHPTLIAHLVAIATGDVAVMVIEEIASDLRVANGSNAATDEGRPASREEAEALIRDLLDVTATWAGHVRAYQCERAMHLDSIEAIRDGQLTIGTIAPIGPTVGGTGVWRALAFPIRPLFDADGLFAVRLSAEWVEATTKMNWPAASATAPRFPTATQRLRDLVLHPLTASLMPSFDRALLLHYRHVALRRLAAVRLAMRLYEIDHGEEPRDLAELVPRYLEVLPPDPFASDGRSLGHNREADRPVLYSVSTNGSDERGAFSLRASMVDSDPSDDLPFFVRGNRPRSVPASASQPAASAPAAPATRPSG